MSTQVDPIAGLARLAVSGLMPIIEIVPSRQSWVADFAMLRCSVMRAAPDGAYIHHIGSTAVPGLPGKDVIDLQLTVRDLADPGRYRVPCPA